jgi:hypothetical protein
MTFKKVKFMLRTKMMVSYFPRMRFCNSLPAAGRRPKGIIFFVHRIPAYGFSLHPFPRATFRFVPHVPKFRDALG